MQGVTQDRRCSNANRYPKRFYKEMYTRFLMKSSHSMVGIQDVAIQYHGVMQILAPDDLDGTN